MLRFVYINLFIQACPSQFNTYIQKTTDKITYRKLQTKKHTENYRQKHIQKITDKKTYRKLEN